MITMVAYLSPIAIGLVAALALLEVMHKDNHEPAPKEHVTTKPVSREHVVQALGEETVAKYERMRAEGLNPKPLKAPPLAFSIKHMLVAIGLIVLFGYAYPVLLVLLITGTMAMVFKTMGRSASTAKPASAFFRMERFAALLAFACVLGLAAYATHLYIHPFGLLGWLITR